MPISLSGPAPDAETPELLFCNALARTMDPRLPLASVLAVRGRELLYVGSDRNAAARMLSPRATVCDLEGAPVIPGLIDGHAHLFSEGLRLEGINLFQKSKEEILDIVRRETAARPPGQWVTGHGWNQEEWPDHAWPSREELDAVAPDHPVVLDRMDKHSLWANSRALAAAGITDATPQPHGGEILRTASGRVQGILVGTATQLARSQIPAVDSEGRRRALLRGQQEFLSFGVTSLMEATSSLQHLAVMEQAYAAGELKLRIRLMLHAHGKQDQLYLASGRGPTRGQYGERLSVAGVKILVDGSLGSRSAWLLEEYADRPGSRGDPRYDDAALLDIMQRARANDMVVAAHAIGDAAVRQTISVMERALGPDPGARLWRIEHMQLVAPEDLRRILASGVIPSIQTVGLLADMDMAEARLGPKAIQRAYAWRDLLDQGGILVNGSDCPIQTPNPFVGMHAAITRAKLCGKPAGGWFPRHKLTRMEALQSYTVWGAQAEGAEARKGSLTPGKLADFVVLDRDLLCCPEEEIKDARVRMTVLGGELFPFPD